MNLVQLKYFLNVCIHKKISDAAKVLHISQPSLSSSIKELESEFGVTLFMRHHSGMELTEEGKILFNFAENILSDADHAEHIMCNLGKKRQTLRLGVPPMIGSVILPDIFKKFCCNNPDISVEITEAGTEKLTRILLDGHLDLIFMPHNDDIDSHFTSLKIADLEIVCCISKNNSLSRRKQISLQELQNEPLVLFKNSFYQTEEIKKRFLYSGINPNILLQTDQLSTVRAIIENNIAIGFLFKNLINDNSSFNAVSLNDKMYASVSLVWNKNAYMLDSMKRFIKYTEKLTL